MNRFLVTLTAGLLLGAPVVSRAQTAVTTCGGTTSNGILTADLDCTGTPGLAVGISKRGTFDLAGYTLTGGVAGGVGCVGHCTIEGSAGTIIAGPTGAGVVTVRGRVEISNVTIFATGGRQHYGVGSESSRARVTISDSTVISGHVGAGSRHVAVHDSTFMEQWTTGVEGSRSVLVEGCDVSGGGGIAVTGRRATVIDSMLTGNSTPAGDDSSVIGKRVVILGSTIAANHGGGLSAKTVRASGSTIGGNGLDDDCDAFRCADIRSRRKPAVESTSCDTSSRTSNGLDTGETWGVCALD